MHLTTGQSLASPERRWGPWAAPLGCAFIQFAAPVAWVVRDLAGGGKSPVFSAGALLFGAALSVNPVSFRRGVLYGRAVDMAPVLISILVMAVFSLVPTGDVTTALDGHSLGTGPIDTRGLVTTIILLIFALGIFGRRLEEFEQLAGYFTILGTIAIAVFVAYLLQSGSIIDLLLNARVGGVDQTSGGAPMTVGTIGVGVIVAAVTWVGGTRPFRLSVGLISTPAVLLGLLLMFAARSRTTIIGLVFSGAAYAFAALLKRRVHEGVARRVRRKGFSRSVLIYVLILLGTLAAIVIAMAAAGVLDDVAIALSKFGNFLSAGASTIFGASGPQDRAATDRVNMRNAALEHLGLLGHGYQSFYLDNPILQSYYDFGLIGGTAFVIATVLIPARVTFDLMLNMRPPLFVTLATASYLAIIPRLLLAEQPYYYSTWTWIIMFYGLSVRYWSTHRTARLPESLDRQSVAFVSGQSST